MHLYILDPFYFQHAADLGQWMLPIILGMSCLKSVNSEFNNQYFQQDELNNLQVPMYDSHFDPLITGNTRLPNSATNNLLSTMPLLNLLIVNKGLHPLSNSDYPVLKGHKTLYHATSNLQQKQKRRKYGNMRSTQDDSLCRNVCTQCADWLMLQWSSLCWNHCDKGGLAFNACLIAINSGNK